MVEIFDSLNVALYGYCITSDEGHGLIEFALSPTSDVDERSRFGEPCSHCESEAATAAGDDGHFSVKL